MKVILNFIFLTFVSLMTAQGYKHYGLENGLLSNRIYKVVQDDKGFIWIATDKGLSKFDGKSFQHFTIKNGLPSNDIWEIFYLSPGKLWFFTRANALGYIQNDSVHLFYAANKEVFYPIRIHTGNQNISFHSFKKNYKLIDNQWQAISEKDSLNKQKFEINHHKITQLRFNKHNQFLFYGKKNILKSIPFEEKIDRATRQINDSLFAILTNENLFFINLNNLRIHKTKNFKRENNKIFVRIYATPQHIQISTGNYFAILDDDYSLTDIIHFDNKHNFINIFKDKMDNYWVSSYSQGLFMYPKNVLRTEYFLHNHKVTFLKKEKNYILVGTYDEGVYLWKDSQKKFKKLYDTNDYIYDVYFINPENYVLFGQNACIFIKNNTKTEFLFSGKKAIRFKNYYYTTAVNGLMVFDSHLEYIKKIFLPAPNIFTLYQNQLIVGSLDGLYKVDSLSVSKIFPNFNRQVLTMQHYKGKLFIGTENSGLFVIQNNKIKQIKETNGLMVNDIAIHDEKIWLATPNGVLVYTYNNNKFRHFKTIRKIDGLPSDQVINIAFDGDRLFSASYNNISLFKVNGEPNLPLQNIYIKKITYGNQKLNDDASTQYQRGTNLSIAFGAIDFSGQEHNQYFYRLLPLQKKWQPAHTQIIEFNNLSPKKYTLHVKAKNPYRQELEQQFSFEILPLWWQTSWAKIFFILLTLSILISTGYLIRKVELSKQRKKMIAQKEMAEFELYALRSQMNPHFVFNSLNAILYYINDENFDKSESYLIKFSRLVRMIFDFSREKTISLANEISLLKAYLELEKMRFGDNFNYCFNIDPKINTKNTEIPTMFLQPIVENAVNHGLFHKKGKGLICIEIQQITKKTIEIQVKDDGVGIEKSAEINRKSLKKHLSKSTQILKKRIELINRSQQWKISHDLKDILHAENQFNTIVTLKITKL